MMSQPSAVSRARIAPRRPKTLPVGYHLRHFQEMLDFVERIYAHVLDDVGRTWLADFRALDPSAQSLLVRMANRKGSVFRKAHLRYEDVEDLGRSLTHLISAEFAGPLQDNDFENALSVLTKDQVFDLLAESHADEGVRRSWPRLRIVAAVQARLEFEECFGNERRDEFVVQRRIEPLRYFFYLYFGRIEESLTRFALRDLGLMRVNGTKGEFEARFETRRDAEECYFFADRLARFDPINVAEVAANVETWPEPAAAAIPLRDQLLFEIGRTLERNGEGEASLSLYQKGTSAECRERLVRLLYAGGNRESVRAHLNVMIKAPLTDAEALFAEDFLERKFGGKRTSSLTDMLRSAPVLEIDDSYRMSPERGAKARFEREGWSVRHSENTPWRSLFGLLFWEELYGQDAAGLHNEFDRLPKPLRDKTFFEQNRRTIEGKLSLLSDHRASLRAILKTYAAAHGTPNAVFRWRGDLIEIIQSLLTLAPPDGLASVLREMALNYPERKDGFPDLMLTKDNALRLIEIKTENDVIRRNQLMQLKLLREAGFDVDVNRVQWIIDPEQVYVVVDIETTGGRPPTHRITEIGAVKAQGGDVIDRWQSLINPERSIPQSIARLTGIDEAMVAGAPRFAQIADEFEAFVGDGVFVAHNVRFDHGFIAAEYARLDRRFRCPQLCTCQSMRTLYKGLPSYGLANLCHHFEISLDTHHRAMCDAEAAAELLTLVNQRRIAGINA